ncbi:hypothetical protein MHB48_05195 [Psychrobacillus sp. FSL H8-0483]
MEIRTAIKIRQPITIAIIFLVVITMSETLELWNGKLYTFLFY